MVARWEGVVTGRAENGKRLRSTDWQLQNSQGDVPGNIVNNIVVTVYGARRVLDLPGGSPRQLYKCLTTTLHTWTTVLNVNCNWKIK